MSLRIEEYNGKFEICSDNEDGTIDVHGVFLTREEAQADLDSAAASAQAESFYAAQMAWACGYHD